MTDDLAFLDATAHAELVRTGQASPVELVRAAIARIEAVDPELNAVIHPRFEQALAEAEGPLPDGPLRGVPIVLKDLDGTAAGDPYHAGTAHLRRLGHVATSDSHLTARFRAAGLVTVGRTNTPELGLQPTTEPAAFGPTRNPWDTGRSTGGSSGGSAAAVASGMVPLGHAGDGGGSIRIPASECGLFGLKPSRGRISMGPEVGEAWGGLVARLVVSRSVRDTALVLDCVRGAAPGDPYTAPPPARPYVEELNGPAGPLRVAFTTTSPDPAVMTDPACVAAVEQTARQLEALGHVVVERAPAVWSRADELAEVTTHFINAFAAWTALELEELGEACGEPFGPDGVEPGTWAVAELGRTVTAGAYLEAIGVLHRYGRSLAELWSGPDACDVLLTPTLPEPPPTLGQFASTPDDPLAGLFRSAAIVPFVAPFNMSGQPAASVPMHWSEDGLPIGVQLVGAAWRDDVVLALAAQLEEAAPWAQRRPPVHA